jgi:hypothetical protein
MGAPTSSYATADIALRVSGALKPHHHDKVETPSVGFYLFIMLIQLEKSIPFERILELFILKKKMKGTCFAN